MLACALPGRKLASHTIISGGCANLNIKIEFEKGELLILRIYLRDLPQLVHGDYDLANILVYQVKGKRTISAVLGWKFAFSGSTLWNVTTMLRYAHCMSLVFEASFLDGLNQG